MSVSAEEFNRSRLRTSNVTVVVSISLVLFLVGLFGLILINAERYSDYIKEQLVIQAFLEDPLDPRDSMKTDQFQAETFARIKSESFVKSARFISKKQATARARKDLGINTKELFEEDIFPASVDITLKPDFVEPTKLEDVTHRLSKLQGVESVKSDSQLTIEVYNNLRQILGWIIGFSVLFFIIAIILINNSIRLKIFSKRFILKTMQLVGARRRFILAPFIRESVILGLVGALIGLSLLGILWYYFTQQIGQIFIPDPLQYSQLAIGVILVGILLTVTSTLVVTWRFLSTRVEDMYTQ